MCEKGIELSNFEKENGCELDLLIERNIAYTKALNPDSVEIVLGAKGEVKFTVKSYAGTVEEAKEKATEIFDSLFKQYYGIDIYKTIEKK